ncbi:TRAP transporter substrate-binding protein [Martelella sp. FLE1502]
MAKLGSTAFFASAALVTVLAAAAGAQAACDPSAAGKTLKLGHVVPADPNHPYHAAALMMKEDVEEASACKIQIEIYPAGQLGGDRGMLESLKIGTQDMGVISGPVASAFTPVLDALSLPWLFGGDLDFQYEILSGPDGDTLLQAFEDDTGIVALGYVFQPFRNFVSEKPIEDIADFKGVKVRSMENPLHMETFRDIGASPTPVPYPELYGALETGVVDAFDGDVIGVYGGKYYEVANNITLSNHFTTSPVILMSQFAWNGLDEEQQGWFREAAAKASARTLDITKEFIPVYTEKLEAEGVTFHTIDIESLREATKPIYDEYRNKSPEIATFLDAVEAARSN